MFDLAVFVGAAGDWGEKPRLLAAGQPTVNHAKHGVSTHRDINDEGPKLRFVDNDDYSLTAPEDVRGQHDPR